MVTSLPYNAEASLTEAEADCRAEQYDACFDAADRVLGKSPDNVRALAWEGIAMTHRAIAGPPAARAAALVAARKPIVRAAHLDPDAPLPLIAYYRSFADAGEPAPEQGILAIVKVARIVPAAPAPRLYLAQELVRQGHGDVARRVLNPILVGGYHSPEQTIARSLVASSAAAKSGGS